MSHRSPTGSLGGVTIGPEYDPLMRSLPTILLVLSFPAGAVAYLVSARVLESLSLPSGAEGFLVLIVPLFVAGLVMMPFLIPFFDRKAKADLAEHARSQAAAATPPPEPPDQRHG